MEIVTYGLIFAKSQEAPGEYFLLAQSSTPSLTTSSKMQVCKQKQRSTGIGRKYSQTVASNNLTIDAEDPRARCSQSFVLFAGF